MDNHINPGLLLGSVDLIGLVVGFVYIQKQLEELRIKIGEDSPASENLKNIKINSEVFDQNFKSFAERLKLHEMVLTSFGDRIAQLEKKISESTTTNNTNSTNTANNNSSTTVNNSSSVFLHILSNVLNVGATLA